METLKQFVWLFALVGGALPFVFRIRQLSLKLALAKTQRLWNLSRNNKLITSDPMTLQLAISPAFGFMPLPEIKFGINRADPFAFFVTRKLAKKWVRLADDGSNFQMHSKLFRYVSPSSLARLMLVGSGFVVFAGLFVGFLVWDQGFVWWVAVGVEFAICFFLMIALSVQLDSANELVEMNQVSLPKPPNETPRLTSESDQVPRRKPRKQVARE